MSPGSKSSLPGITSPPPRPSRDICSNYTFRLLWTATFVRKEKQCARVTIHIAVRTMGDIWLRLSENRCVGHILLVNYREKGDNPKLERKIRK